MPGFEWIDDEEKNAVISVFDEGGILFAHGFDKLRKYFHVREFEEKAQEYFQVKHSQAVSSGTAAIKIALKSVGVQPGDEVITQAFNFIATVEAILDCGAVPIIANIDSTLNMDVEDLKSLITQKTKAIIPVHMLGVAANMKSIIELASEHSIPVVEDNCEAIGATYNNKFLGTLTQVGVISFDHGKMVATGEGGMLLTKDTVVYKYASDYHDHGHENNPDRPRGRDTHSIFGFNYRMTEMQGAVGKVQLNKLDRMLKANKERYQALENNMGGKFQLRTIPEECIPTYDTLILIEPDEQTRKTVIDTLVQEGFGTKNLPDAMEWHCTSYWDHALDAEQVVRSKKTQQILEEAVAVPVWLRKTVKDYRRLGNLLGQLK
jgi:8-amino-3,8-dideoxy-alpha-D-manno-octulosonate transaminase